MSADRGAISRADFQNILANLGEPMPPNDVSTRKRAPRNASRGSTMENANRTLGLRSARREMGGDAHALTSLSALLSCFADARNDG